MVQDFPKVGFIGIANQELLNVFGDGDVVGIIVWLQGPGGDEAIFDADVEQGSHLMFDGILFEFEAKNFLVAIAMVQSLSHYRIGFDRK